MPAAPGSVASSRVRWARRAVALAALAACSGALAAALAPAATRHVIRANYDDETGKNLPYAYVRDFASGYVIGTAYARGGFNGTSPSSADVMYVERTSPNGYWAYGKVFGNFGTWKGTRCAWVRVPALESTGQSEPDTCPHENGLDAASIFAPGSYDEAGYGKTRAATISDCPGGPGAWGEYDPSTGTFSNRYGFEPVGRQLPGGGDNGWRYLTQDGRAVMVRDDGNTAGAPRWFFMPSACIHYTQPAAPPPPPTPPAGTPPAPTGTPPGSAPARRRSGLSVRCRRHSFRGHRHRRLVCVVRYPRLRHRRAVLALRVTRAHRRYAFGRARLRRGRAVVVLRAPHRLRRGSYTLRVRIARRHHRTLVAHRRLRIH